MASASSSSSPSLRWIPSMDTSPRSSSLQKSGMLSREQLFRLFDEFLQCVELPEVKARIADRVKEKQEAVAVTTEIQEEILLKIGVDPKFGIACLGKVNAIYRDDREVMLKFYKFVASEEMVCDEAELGPVIFQQRMQQLKKVQEEQLKMLQQIRGLPLEQQREIIQGFQKKI